MWNGEGIYLPSWILPLDIPPGAKILYAQLSSLANNRSGYAYPKQATLAKALGCSDRQIRNLLKHLTADRCLGCFALIDPSLTSCKHCASITSMPIQLVRIKVAEKGIKSPRLYKVWRKYSSGQGQENRKYSSGQSGKKVPTEIKKRFKNKQKGDAYDVLAQTESLRMKEQRPDKPQGDLSEVFCDEMSQEFREYLATQPMAEYLCKGFDEHGFTSPAIIAKAEEFLAK
jgi:hypothetical protein